MYDGTHSSRVKKHWGEVYIITNSRTDKLFYVIARDKREWLPARVLRNVHKKKKKQNKTKTKKHQQQIFEYKYQAPTPSNKELRNQ